MTLSVRWIANEVAGGNFYGFGKHSAQARAGLEDLGVTIDPAAPVAVHVDTPLMFHPCADARNVLLTHWEYEHVPADVAEKLDAADLVVAGSTWAAAVLGKHTRTKVLASPLGVDRRFRPRRRQLPKRGEPFVFLFVGAPNLRKGIDLVAHERGIWREFGWHARGDVMLYVKTSASQSEGTVEVVGNTIVDSRRLPADALLELYYRAHCFLFPTRGEGFGLPLAEAIATGCPALYTDVGGVRDFARSPVPSIEVPFMGRDGFSVPTELRTMVPDPHMLNAHMERTVRDYRKARSVAFERGREVYRRFTWERHAESLLAAIASVGGAQEAA